MDVIESPLDKIELYQESNNEDNYLLIHVPNGFNSTRSHFNVQVNACDLHTLFIIEERLDNQGPSITNCAEYVCPIISNLFSVEWHKCLFYEHYICTDSLSQILFTDEDPVDVYSGNYHTSLPMAKVNGWRYVDPESTKRIARINDNGSISCVAMNILEELTS